MALLVHSVRAIKYRFIAVTTGSKESFGEFRVSPQTRTPNEIIHHMVDLVTKTGVRIREGHFNVPEAMAVDFEEEKMRMLQGLDDLTGLLETVSLDLDLACRLLQGPLLDITTHIGQLALLNGLHGNRIPRQDYFSQVIQ